jgi:hypothetical protein
MSGTDAASFGVASRNGRVNSGDIIRVTYGDGTFRIAVYVQDRYLLCTETKDEINQSFIRWEKLPKNA